MKHFILLLIVIVSISTGSCNKNQNPYAIIASPLNTESRLSFAPVIIQEASLMTAKSAHLDAAIDFWNKSTGKAVFRYGGDKYPVVFNFVSSIEMMVGDEKAAAFSLHFADKCIITMTHNGPSRDYDPISTIEHELGHCLGFAHSSNPESIMYYIVDTTQHITTEMLALMYPTSDPS